MAKQAVHLTIDIENKSAGVYGFIVGFYFFPIRRNNKGERFVQMLCKQKRLLKDFLQDCLRYGIPVWLDTSEGQQLLITDKIVPTLLFWQLVRRTDSNIGAMLDCWFEYKQNCAD